MYNIRKGVQMAKNTKQILADALDRLLEKKPLEKIRINDLTEACGVNRQTFYYHFHDIYELVEWMYLTQGQQAIGKHRTYRDWSTGMKALCELMLKKKSFLTKTYHCASHHNLQKIISDSTFQLIYEVVRESASDYVITDEAIRFIASFYKNALSGIVMDWIANGMQLTPEELVGYVARLMQGNFEDSIRKFAVRIIN